jgi:hypothetical protein
MKSLTLYLLINLFVTAVYSQTYVPFPTDSAIWRERLVTQSGPYSFRIWDHQYILTGDDTTVNSHIYRKVIFRYHYYQDGGIHVFNPAVADTFDVILGLRENNKKVYGFGFEDTYHYPPDTIERLLYDFNLNIGDTARFDAAGYGVLTKIDSVLIDGTYRKRYLLSSGWWNPEYIIEGIGSTQGLLPYGPHINASDLLCFSYKDMPLYEDSSHLCQYIYQYGTRLHIPGQLANSDLTVSPNPFSNYLNIKTKQTSLVRIYNLMGVVMWSQKINNNVHITVNDLPAGMYLLVIKNESGQIIEQQKLVKLD